MSPTLLLNGCVVDPEITVRVRRHWNRLPVHVVDALFLEVFKARLHDALSNLVSLPVAGQFELDHL